MATVSTSFTLTINTGFDEPLFPEGISYGSRGGPGFNTAIVTTDSGTEERSSRWTDPLRQYNAAFGVRSQDDLSEVLSFYMARNGAQGDFRFKDWGDYATTPNHTAPEDGTGVQVTFNDVNLGAGDGSQTAFQLVKRYTDGPNVKVRNITKPRSGTLVVALDGVQQFSGFSIDTTTGILLFTVAPAFGVQVTVGFEFDVPCRFGDETDRLLSITFDAFESASAQIPIVEVRDETFSENEFYFGGAKDFNIVADTVISLATGRVLRIDSGAVSNLEVILPKVDNLEPGGPYFYIVNRGTNFLRIVPSQGIGVGQELANLLQDETITVLLADNNGTKEWVGLT